MTIVVDVGKKGAFVHFWWECKLVQPSWKTVGMSLKKLRVELPCDPTILLLGINTKNINTQIQKYICTPMFITVIFTIEVMQKQPKYS